MTEATDSSTTKAKAKTKKRTSKKTSVDFGDLDMSRVVTSDQLELGVHRLYPDAQMPMFSTEQSGCFDLKCFLSEPVNQLKAYTSRNQQIRLKVTEHKGKRSVTIPPGTRTLINSGLVFDIPEGYAMEVLSRSSTGFKRGLSIPHSVGFIDSDYTEETFIVVQNNTDVRIRIEDGDRILQARLVKTIPTRFSELKSRPGKKTSRSGGFGSTGK